MRRSLSLKDDDYRLSFLFGNFTTLTRFTEADLERVVTEGLSPLYVSIHATDPEVRADLLRNRRGATSLRWLRLLLDHGITVHGQIVVCPGLNDGDVLDDTLCGVADRYPELATLAVVPLGLSRYNTAARMRPHTDAEAAAVIDVVEAWQERFLDVLGRRLVFAADEYYVMTGRPFPPAGTYEGFPLHEDGVGMARAFEAAFRGDGDALGPRPGFFAWSDGGGAAVASGARPAGHGAGGARGGADPVPSRITAAVAGYRAPRHGPDDAGVPGAPVALRPSRRAPVAILTGSFGASVLGPYLPEFEAVAGAPVRLVPVDNRFFGGTIGVTGLLVGEDLERVLAAEPEGHRYLLPDVCLSEGRFLDGRTPDDLPRPVEIVPTDGASLRRALERRP
jgi:NifB/MoaA-like Fe-S oxidoreductase